MKNPCPICGEELSVQEDWLDSVQCECYMLCTHCQQYCYEFMYGFYRESIGDPDSGFYKDFAWNYKESREDGNAKQQDIKKAIEEAKKIRQEESKC